MRRRGRYLLVFALAVALLLRRSVAQARPFELSDHDWEGCAGLLELARAELGAPRTIATSALDWSELKPNDAVLIIAPDHAADGDELASFLGAGGRVAVLDDFAAGDKILSRFHIERVPAPSHPAATLRHNPELALAEPATETLAGYSGVHPVVVDVQRLVTNHPTGLRHPKLAPVLRIRADDEADVVLALAGVVGPPGGQGRLFAMGDPSAIMNQMLRYPGNRSFATGLVKYLVEDESTGRKGGKLYLVSGRFTETGTYGGASTWAKELESRMKELAAAIRALATEGLPGALSMGLAAAAAIGVSGWTLVVAAKTYKRAAPRFARRTPLFAQGGVAGRAAVLAASSTAPALAMLELKSALEEGLGQKLGFDRPAPMVLLLEAVRAKRALDEPAMGALKEVLLEMANVETSVAAGQPRRVSPRELERVAAQVSALLAMADERLASPGVA